MRRPKIVLIENQIWQFKEIREHLTKLCLPNEGYRIDISPEEDGFVSFMNRIKRGLNVRYSDHITVRNRICGEIKNQSPDLIIIDHILVGSHDANDGIDLARSLYEQGYTKPIIFFSRTERNNYKVCEKLSTLPKEMKTEWVCKNYSNQQILTREILDNLNNTVSGLLLESAKHPAQKYIDLLDSWKPTYYSNLQFLAEINALVNLLKDKRGFSDEDYIALDGLSTCETDFKKRRKVSSLNERFIHHENYEKDS